jgi:cytochrome P450
MTENTETTVFHSLLMNSNLPNSEKTEGRLADDARILLQGSTDTTAIILSAITCQILANPSISKRLKQELAQAIPDPDSLPASTQIAALPYLTTVIQDGIRLHPGASGRQERVAPGEDLACQDVKGERGYVIPKGVSGSVFAEIFVVQNHLISARLL